jgi:RNA polymerase sigma-19 factor, ECF subfamily
MVDDRANVAMFIRPLNILLKSIFHKAHCSGVIIFTVANMRKMFLHRFFNRSQISRRFREHAPGLKRYAFTLLKDEKTAEEMVQFVGDHSVIPERQNNEQPELQLHLYQSVYFHCIKKISEEKCISSSAFSSEDLVPAEQNEAEEKQWTGQLGQWLLGLPLHYQHILYKSRFEKKNFSEIAFEMNLSVRNIEKQMANAFRMLKDQWQQTKQKNSKVWLTN